MVGNAGAGKSTFAHRLAALTAADRISLDEIWQADWDAPDVPTFRDALGAAHSSTRWVSDGNYAEASFDIRLPRATLIVWLEEPRHVCLWRAVKRVFRRDSGHPWTRLGTVLLFVWRFDRRNRPKIERQIALHGPTLEIRRLRGRNQIEQFLDEASPRVLRDKR